MFEFYVVIRHPDLELELRLVRLSRNVQQSLTALFECQRVEFSCGEVEYKEFVPTYQLGSDELFRIPDFELPASFSDATQDSSSIGELNNAFEHHGPTIKAVIAVDCDTEAMYFQSFNRSHILDTKRTLFLESHTFQQLESPAVQIDNKLAAVVIDGNLIFKSFYAVRQFLPLDSVFREATDEDVRTVLAHNNLIVESGERVIAKLSSRSRKKIAHIIASGVLDHPKATAKRIQKRSRKFSGLDVKTRRRDDELKVVFPSTPSQIDLFLRFLAEEFYISEITQEPRATNSHEKYKPASTL